MTQSPVVWGARLYLGVLIFSVYILYDTQQIVWKAVAGDRDFIGHSIELYLDFLTLFLRICRVLAYRTELTNKKKSE